jgi:hypothetical protein
MSNNNLLRMEALYIINEYWCARGCWGSQGIIPFKQFTAIELYITAGEFLSKGGRWNESPDA